MTALEILGIANALLEVAATIMDWARAAGATPEELAAARAKAIARFRRADEAVGGAHPPPIGEN